MSAADAPDPSLALSSPDGSSDGSDEHRPELLRFLASRMQCQASAEDVAQEAYLRMAAYPSAVRNPRAFLFQAAANLMRNVIRGNRRRAAFVQAAQLLSASSEMRTPERQVLANEALERVELAIRGLPPQCGRVFYLHRFEGLTQREIAERLGISVTAVEKSMRRAFARLVEAADPTGVMENQQASNEVGLGNMAASVSHDDPWSDSDSPSQNDEYLDSTWR